ncbi:MAG: hypothetical protein ACK58L_12390, partial [Planctomycetota bacterium]
MIPVARLKHHAINADNRACAARLHRPSSSATLGKSGFCEVVRLSVFAIVPWFALPVCAQEPVPAALPPITPVIEGESVQAGSTISSPPMIDQTVAHGQDSIDSQTPTFTSNAAIEAVQTQNNGQNPPPPLPEPTSALPPVNADEMDDSDRDELLRGPVHEAFAEQFNTDPISGLIVPQKPPEAIEEMAPELKPDGRQVEWISGYWAWDDEQEDFIWVSGIWREVPQGFRWLPGYWTEVEGGYQWVSGTWVSTQSSEINYLEEAPPQTLEQGPVGDAPTVEHIWIPGSWIWSETRYVWRPGYWSTGYSSWVWVPARYQWTPRGYYFCDGYWDYPVARRGVLFAPSYFHRRFRYRQISRFTPRVVVASNNLTVHFWVRPRYRHYYFGNYYDVAWSNRGLTPWHQFPRQRRCFDPLYAYYGRGQNNDYFNQLNVQFNVFVNQANRRPPVRFRDQDRWVQDHREFRADGLLGDRFQNFVNVSSEDQNGFRFVRLENRQRERVEETTSRLRELVNQRRDVERSLEQLDRMRDSGDNSNRIGNDATALVDKLSGRDQRPVGEGAARVPRLRDRIADSNGEPAEHQTEEKNPLTTDNQERDPRRRDRLRLDDAAPDGRGDLARNEQGKTDQNRIGGPSSVPSSDQTTVVDSSPRPNRDKASDNETREPRQRNPRDEWRPETRGNGEDSDPKLAGVGRSPIRPSEKTESEAGIPIIAVESDAKSEPREQDRRDVRERLMLPPVGNTTDNGKPRGIMHRNNNTGDVSQPDVRGLIGNGSENDRNQNSGRKLRNGNSAPSMDGEGRIPFNDVDPGKQDGLREQNPSRQTDRPIRPSPGSENPSGPAVRENSARSRAPSSLMMPDPPAGTPSGNIDKNAGAENISRLRNSGSFRRSPGESSLESPNRKRSPSLTGPMSEFSHGSPPADTPAPEAIRPSRRETVPTIENTMPRVRASETLR